MQHTVGYKSSAALPITIAYKCSKCGYLNIHKCELQANSFGFTEDSANKDINIELNLKIRTIQESNDWNDLKSVGLDGVCFKCKNAEKWSSKKPPTKLFSFGSHKNNKDEGPFSEEARPIIVLIGKDDANNKEAKRLRLISFFMEHDKDNFYRTIEKCKDAKSIAKKCQDLTYSELFTEDLLSSIQALIQKETIDSASQKEAAVKHIKEFFSKLEEEIPLAYLNSLKKA